jgi:hypothetical protein
MAALMPTVDAVMRPAFGRPKIMEALELFGVRAAPIGAPGGLSYPELV